MSGHWCHVWKAQNFSYWVTNLLHRQPDEEPFAHQRRRGEFDAITGSRYGVLRRFVHGLGKRLNSQSLTKHDVDVEPCRDLLR